jgi:hypothetical protein
MSQDFIEQNVRMLLGDMMLQTIMLKARIAELEAALDDDGSIKPPPKAAKKEDRVNGQG